MHASTKGDEEWNRLLSEASLDGLLIHEDGIIVHANTTFAEMTRCGIEEIIGRPVFDFVEASCRERVREAMAAGREEPYEIEGLRADGTTLPVRIRSRNRSLGGREVRVVAVEDLSERRSLETTVGESERRLIAEREFAEGVFNTAPVPMLVIDLDGRIFRFNQAVQRMTGYRLGEVRGRHAFDLFIPEEEREAVEHVLESLRAGEEVPAFEGVWRTRDGEERLVNWAFTTLKDADGETTHILACGIDLTEERRLEKQLRQSQKLEAIGRLAGGIAHDFNNLLMAISGNAELALARMEPDAPARERVEEITTATRKAASLTGQLLAFSRRQMVQPQVLDLNAVVEEMTSMLQRLIGEDIELHWIPDPDLGSVRIDQGQLEQIILNLAVNARDAMPRGGKLTFESSDIELDTAYVASHVGVTPGSYVLLSVTDTGTGIEKEVEQHLFEPFFSTKDGGTGMGLATVYGIVKQNGGNVWVYSEVGSGTTFKVYLPRVAEVPEAQEREEPSAHLPTGTESILVVEDAAPVRELVRELLQDLGYTVVVAADGVEALRLIEDQPAGIDLLVSDVIMPEMSGRELADRLLEAHPSMQVLFMSGYSDNAIVHHGVIDADVHFLQKPFSQKMLARKVREVLDSTGRDRTGT